VQINSSLSKESGGVTIVQLKASGVLVHSLIIIRLPKVHIFELLLILNDLR
jgi:hypothetical protein